MKIHQTMNLCYPEDEAFLAALWADVQANAKLLGLKRYCFELREDDLTNERNTYHIGYTAAVKPRLFFIKRPTRSGNFHQETYAQQYDATEDAHGYHGQVKMWVGAVSIDDWSKLKHFAALNFQAYYRQIAEHYPNYTTRYIDAPKKEAK